VALQIDEVGLSEGTLVERARRADPAAFEDLYNLYHDRLYRYCQYRLHSVHDAEDAVQETFARAWKALPSFAGERIYPWLRVIARNLCADTGRRRARVEPVAEIEPGAFEGFESELTHQVDVTLVRAAMARLNERQRTALQWREQEELSYEEIAARAGVSIGTVESLLWRARQGLKRQFELLAGSEGVLGGVPGLAWLASRLRRFHARASEWVARWSQPIVSVGNFAVISAVGVAAAVGGFSGVGTGRSNLSSVAVAQVGMSPQSLVSVNAATAGSEAVPGALPASSAPPAVSAGQWSPVPTPADPISTSEPAAGHEASTDPLYVNVPGVASVGVDPGWAVSYARDVVKNHVPPSSKGVVSQ